MREGKLGVSLEIEFMIFNDESNHSLAIKEPKASYHIDGWVSARKTQLLAYIDGLVQEKCDSSALAMELRLSCTNPSI